MRKKLLNKYIIIFFLLLFTTLYSQTQKIITSKDSNYINLIDSFPSRHSLLNDSLKFMLLNRFKSIVRILFNQYDKNPLAVDNEIENNHHWTMSPTLFEALILRNTKSKLSKIDYMLLKARCLVKAKILDIRTIKYKVEGGPKGLDLGYENQTNVKINIQEVFKGKGYFNKGDTVTFYYFPNWRPTHYNFEIGETCLIPLQPLIDNISKKTVIALMAWIDPDGCNEYSHKSINSCTYGRYPIINDTLIDNSNTFGLGNKIKWENLRTILINEINNIKLW